MADCRLSLCESALTRRTFAEQKATIRLREPAQDSIGEAWEESACPH